MQPDPSKLTPEDRALIERILDTDASDSDLAPHIPADLAPCMARPEFAAELNARIILRDLRRQLRTTEQNDAANREVRALMEASHDDRVRLRAAITLSRARFTPVFIPGAAPAHNLPKKARAPHEAHEPSQTRAPHEADEPPTHTDTAPSPPCTTQHSAPSTQHSAFAPNVCPTFPTEPTPDDQLPQPLAGRSAQDTIDALRTATSANFPFKHTYARAIRNLISPRYPIPPEPFEHFADEHRARLPNITGDHATYKAVSTRKEGDTEFTTITLTLTYPTVRRYTQFEFELSRSKSGPHPGCWLIDQITRIHHRAPLDTS